MFKNKNKLKVSILITSLCFGAHSFATEDDALTFHDNNTALQTFMVANYTIGLKYLANVIALKPSESKEDVAANLKNVYGMKQHFATMKGSVGRDVFKRRHLALVEKYMTDIFSYAQQANEEKKEKKST